MIFVLFSVLCSVLVSVLLKLTRRLQLDVGQAIAWNYVVTSVLTASLLQPTASTLRGPGVPWLALVALAVLLPTRFLALAAAVRHVGGVRIDAAQRLSFLLALPCMVWRSGHAVAASGVAGWFYPVLVFVGFGVIDILFKRVALAGIPLGDSLQTMFALALLVALAMQLWRRLRHGVRFTARSALAGVVLGAANFGNILFYLRGHRALPDHPALVFASMNIGVVALGIIARPWATGGFPQETGHMPHARAWCGPVRVSGSTGQRSSRPRSRCRGEPCRPPVLMSRLRPGRRGSGVHRGIRRGRACEGS